VLMVTAVAVLITTSQFDTKQMRFGLRQEL
jgi:hypothetical protein